MASLRKAYLEITNVCNLSCDFCPGTRREKHVLSPAQFRTLAEKIRLHTEYLYLHLMGEPLLHPDLAQLLDIAHQLGFRVMITTNGTLLSKQGDLLCTAPAVQKVSISLHSFEGNHPSGTMEDYLTTCTDFAAQAARAGKRCALRLWNLDGEQTQGANSQNTAILAHLHAQFPGEWKEGRRGITMAPSIYLEWGEKFDWPDLEAACDHRSGF